jgi:signal transduction histidine kinase
MSKKSLASVLKVQWWIHTLLTSLFFVAVTFFFLFSMEDYFNEKQLVEMSNLVAVNESIKGMPKHIQMYPQAEVPTVWLTQLEQVAFNDAIEIDSPQGDAIHLVRSQFSPSEEVFVLALDTSKTNSVWDIADELLILILPWMLIFLAMASFLAKKFIRQIQGHFKRLLIIIKQSESADTLIQFSETQSIDELAQFAQLFAQVWQQKFEILTREKQSLEYLSHELRTPIQASLATLELLALKIKDKKTIDRLMRSLNRMTRLSNAILYLMESEKSLPTYPVDVHKVCQQLVEELKPLADIKRQSIVIKTTSTTKEKTPQTERLDSGVVVTQESKASYAGVKIVATREVIETLLSILLTNSLQHSDSSPIIITISNDHISIENEVKQIEPSHSVTSCNEIQQSFGIGLTIAQRLAEKFNLQLAVSFDEQKHVIAIISNI